MFLTDSSLRSIMVCWFTLEVYKSNASKNPIISTKGGHTKC